MLYLPRKPSLLLQLQHWPNWFPRDYSEVLVLTKLVPLTCDVLCRLSFKPLIHLSDLSTTAQEIFTHPEFYIFDKLPFKEFLQY